MAHVAVVTDSTHYLPPALIERHELHQVPLYVNWKGRTDRESELGDFGQFYDYLGSANELPTTSQPSVGDFLAAYEPLLDAGRDIVSVHISGGISGTVRSAEQARDQLVENGLDAARLAIVDSRTAAGGMGITVLAAAGAAEQGRTAGDCAVSALAVREDLKIWFAVDTLEFLRRGGRIGAAQALLGSALKVKPILTLEEEIMPVEKVRTAGRAEARMVEYLRERFEDGCDEFAIQHTRDLERAERLAEAGRAIFGRDPLFLSEIGPVLGTHAGPGVMGVAGARSALLQAR